MDQVLRVYEEVEKLIADGRPSDAVEELERSLETVTDSLQIGHISRRLSEVLLTHFRIQHRQKALRFALISAEAYFQVRRPTEAIAIMIWLRQVANEPELSLRMERVIAHQLSHRRKAKHNDENLPLPTPYVTTKAKLALEDFSTDSFERDQLRVSSDQMPYLFFSKLTPAEIIRLLHCASLLNIRDGANLFKEGERPKAFYVLVDGQIQLRSSSGLERVVGNGEFIGDISLFGDLRHSSTARALEDCRIIAFDEQKLDQCFDTIPRLESEVMEWFRKRLFMNVSEHSLIFNMFEEEGLEKVWDYFIPVNVPADRILMEPTRPSDRFFLLLKGKVEIDATGEGPTAVVGPGHFLGERGVVLRSDRIASVVTLSNCQLLECDSMSFFEMCEEFPEINESLEERRDEIENHRFSPKNFVLD